MPGGQGIDEEGRFAGDPVEIRWTGESAAPYRVVVTMETGVCDVVTFDADGAVVEKWSAQTTNNRGRIQPGGRVKFVAQPGAKGYYHLRMGPLAMWGPALLGARVALLGLSVALVAAWLFGLRVDRRQWDARRRLVVAVIGTTTAFSGIVLYSVVHEAGHLLFGWMRGGTPAWDQVSWTVFSGEEPHVAFRSLPPEAVPWMAAGGMLLPTLLGCALMATGFWRGGRIVWWVQRVLVTAGAVLLLGNLGLLADTGHTLPLALSLGIRGVVAQVVAILPALLALAVYGYMGYRLRSPGGSSGAN
jgi:hypothetical protein